MSTVVAASRYRQASIHLYRQLLRECTYLPDSIARREISKQINARFRAHICDINILQLEVTATRNGLRTGVEKRFKVGHQALRTLKKANQGGLVSLNLVLRHAYGRTGKRRHELVQPLLKQSTPSVISESKSRNHVDPEELHAWDLTTVPIPEIFVAKKHKNRPIVEFHVAPQFGPLGAILASQSKTTSWIRNLSRIKEHIPSISTINSWCRSMPRKRVKNLAIKHYAHLIDRVLPPLPEAEWIRLSELCSGIRPLEKQPARRRKLKPVKPDRLSPQDLEMLVNMRWGHSSQSKELLPVESPGSMLASAGLTLKLPQRLQRIDTTNTWFEQDQLLAQSDQQILEEEMLLGSRFGVRQNEANNPSNITPRLLRRQLATIISECPRTYWNTTSGSWKVSWGASQLPKPEVSAIEPLFQSLNMDAKSEHEVT